MKIYDCFMFSDEKMVLDIRLNVLNEYVDHFSNAQLFHAVKGYVDFVLWTGYLTILKREYYRYKEV